MDLSERRARIRANLGIKPINHGQVYTFQIAVPETEKQNFLIERLQLVEESLIQHQTNLVPLIVRRTDSYSEEEEYELVYGADWCLVAKEIEIEKLWVWVYDMTDEQASVAKEEMQALISSSSTSSVINVDGETAINSTLLDQKLNPIYAKLNQLNSYLLKNTPTSAFDEKIGVIENQVQYLLSTVEALSAKIEKLVNSKVNLLTANEKEKLNLVTATEKEINHVLEKARVAPNQIIAVLQAIKYWQKPGRILSWQNLKSSVKSGEHKIKNFGKSTFDKLKEVADILD